MAVVKKAWEEIKWMAPQITVFPNEKPEHPSPCARWGA